MKPSLGLYGAAVTLVSLAAALESRTDDAGSKTSNPRFPLPESLISLNSSKGRELLWTSTAKDAYVPLSSYFLTQENLGCCGVATSAMVLNSMGIKRPVSEQHMLPKIKSDDQPYRLFTQNNFFTPDVCKVILPDKPEKAAEKVAGSGMTLGQLASALRTYDLDVELVYASEGSPDDFRESAKRTLRRTDAFLITNYLRSAIGQKSVGHISPIAAYHEGEDRFLILDVSRYKYPPVWVAGDLLWKAMCTTDPDTDPKRSRGYLIVQEASRAKETESRSSESPARR